MKIGIVTIFNVPNYGAILQAYALAFFLEKQGHDVILFDVSPRKKYPHLYKIKRFFKLSFIDNFQKKKYPRITSDLESKVDLYMVGSDQVWNPEITKNEYDKYFLSFAQHNKKVAYAASLGNKEWIFNNLSESVGELLSKFDYITVREEQGAQLLLENFSIDAKVVLDPCFLLDSRHYLFGNIVKETNLLVSYKLCNYRNYSSEILNLSKKMNCQIKELRGRHISWLPSCRDFNIHYCSVEEWIYSIASAKYVITDSFHGMVFSLIFQKQFVVLPSINKRSSRIDSILEKLTLLHRKVGTLAEAESMLVNDFIDYKCVDKKVKYLKELSERELLHMIS